PPGRAYCVHRSVASAHHHHIAIVAVVHGLVVFQRAVGAHEIDAREEFIRGIDPVQMLSRDPQEAGQTGTCRDKYRIVVFVAHQLIDGDALSDHDVRFELHTHSSQVVDLFANDGFRQTKLRDAVDKDAAQLMQCLENVYAMALL